MDIMTTMAPAGIAVRANKLTIGFETLVFQG